MNRATPPSLSRYGSELEAAIRRDIDAKQRRRPGTRRIASGMRFGRLWTAIGASGTLLAAAISAAVLLLSSGAPPAYAGYSSAPAQPSRAALSAATKSCDVLAAGYSAIADGMFAHRPVLAEQRGVYVAAVEVRRRPQIALTASRGSVACSVGRRSRRAVQRSRRRSSGWCCCCPRELRTHLPVGPAHPAPRHSQR